MEPMSHIAVLAKLKKALPVGVLQSIDRVVSDPIDAFRAKNLYKILKDADGVLALRDEKIVLNPKVVIRVTQYGSLEGEAELQSWWTGLIVSSNSSDKNLYFTEIMQSITYTQAMIIKYACQRVKVGMHDSGIIYSKDGRFSLTRDELIEFTGIEDVIELDLALDDLRRKDIIDGGFDVDDMKSERIYMTVNSIALNFYAAVSGAQDQRQFYAEQLINDDSFMSTP